MRNFMECRGMDEGPLFCHKGGDPLPNFNSGLLHPKHLNFWDWGESVLVLIPSVLGCLNGSSHRVPGGQDPGLGAVAIQGI